MPYATIDQLTSRLGPDLAALLADDDLDAAPDTAILAAALDDASAQIDTTLSRRYPTPFNPVPERLVRLAVDLAVRHLYLRRREALSAEAASAYATAILELRELAAGRAHLEGATPRTSRLNTESTTREQPKRFDRKNLKPF